MLSGLLVCSVLRLAAQSDDALRQYFEGKQVTLKIDMPATQRGVDVYLNRPQPMDTSSYGDRLKKFGIALRRDDTTMITKVKLKPDGIEFQLGGGGYGTMRDDTDDSVHYTAADKSSREKDLERQLRNETDPNRRRDIERDLDRARRDRERSDQFNQTIAQDDASRRKEQIASARLQGGSRFNIRFSKRPPSEAPTAQDVVRILSAFVVFPPQEFGANGSAPPPPPDAPQDAAPPSAPAAGAASQLKKGLTRAQVEELYGPPSESHVSQQGGLDVTTCTYISAHNTVKADYVNGILVQYTVSSR
jgi:hypothetical protein